MEIKESDLLELGFTKTDRGIIFVLELKKEVTEWEIKTTKLQIEDGSIYLVIYDKNNESEYTQFYPRTLDELKTIIRVFSE